MHLHFAGGMGNKEEEQEAILQQQGCDVVAIREMWRGDCHDWSAAGGGSSRGQARKKRQWGVSVAQGVL